MREPALDTLLFFSDHSNALALYVRFEEVICSLFPEVQKRVQKTQISFVNRHVFACVSFAKVKRKSELPDPYIVLTLGLPYPLESTRVAAKTEPYPGRWTTHIVLGNIREIDDELISWIRQAYDFSYSK